MFADWLRRVVEDLVPWYDRVAEARKVERSRTVAKRSEAALAHAERALKPEDRTEVMRNSFRRGDQRLGGR